MKICLSFIDRPVSTVKYAENILLSDLDKPAKIRKKAKVADSGWKARYEEVHREWFKNKFPGAWNDGHYVKPLFPKVGTANGLTTAIVNYVDWSGGVSNRINVAGRKIGDKFIRSSTKRGTADITAQLPNGVVLYCEIKVNSDRPRPEQIEMQTKVRASKGHYEFIKTMEDFYFHYDRLCTKGLF